MKPRIFSILALALILVTSLAVVGCGGGGGGEPTFAASNLQISANPVEAGTAITISADITNSGASGTGNVTLNVGDTAVNTTSVTIAAKDTQTVSFTYTPSAEGNFNVSVTPGYKAVATLGVIQTNATGGYWDIKYSVDAGSKIILNYSLAGSISPSYHKVVNLSAVGDVVTIRINKTVVNKTYRDITILSSGWYLAPVFVKDISAGADMNMTMTLNTSAYGKLYVQGGIADVDMSSVSSPNTKPKENDTVATGTNAPAGSMLVPMDLMGYAHVTVGNDVVLPFGLTFTTGHTTNVVSKPSSPFNGARLTDNGTPFAKSGPLNLPDYVGTAGTITTTGTGNCLGLTLDTFPIDFQAEIILVLTPVAVD